jgi:hypothetical protein
MWVVSFTHRPLYHRYPLESGWAPEPLWTTWRRENSWLYRDSNSHPSVVQPVASRYTDWATQLGRSVSGFPPWRPGFDSKLGVTWDLWRTKWHSDTSVSPANSHSTKCSILISVIRGWYSEPIIVRRIKWAESHSTPRNIHKWLNASSTYHQQARSVHC